MRSALPVVTPREGYDRWSSSYDGYDNPLVALEGPVVERLVGAVAGATAADVGCGTGRHTLRLAAAGAEVTGVDFSTGMMDVLRAKEPPRSVRLVEHDLREGIPLPSGRFDVVICCLVLEHLERLVPMVAEMARIGRPGGRIVVTDLHPQWTRRGVHARFREAPGGDKQQIEGHAHRISDYVTAGIAAGLELRALEEHAVDSALAQRSASARKYEGELLLLAMQWRVAGD